VMNFAESAETVPDNLREVQPTAFLAVPRIWEKFYSGVTIALKDATPFQNWMYRQALATGYRMTECKLAGDTPPLSLRLRLARGHQAARPAKPNSRRAPFGCNFRKLSRSVASEMAKLISITAASQGPRSRKNVAVMFTSHSTDHGSSHYSNVAPPA